MAHHAATDGWVLVGRDEVPSDLEDVTATVVRDTTLAENAAAGRHHRRRAHRGSELTTDVLVGRRRAARLRPGRWPSPSRSSSTCPRSSFGMTLANSVVEEKQSRIVEIIATKIPVRQLLAGKVIGNTGARRRARWRCTRRIGLVGLALHVVRLVPARRSPGALGWFLVFFLVGFLAHRLPVGGRRGAREPHRGPPVDLDPDDDAAARRSSSGRPSSTAPRRPCCRTCRRPRRCSCRSGSSRATRCGGSRSSRSRILLVAAGVVVLVAERLYRRSLLQTQGRLSMREAWSAPE